MSPEIKTISIEKIERIRIVLDRTEGPLIKIELLVEDAEQLGKMLCAQTHAAFRCECGLWVNAL